MDTDRQAIYRRSMEYRVLGRTGVQISALALGTANFADPTLLAKVSRGLGDAMPGLEIGSLETRLADRGW
jgi:pyridoxal 5'-phosphate synthase pdxS subunit